jgi:hypothetical protein
VGDIIYQIQTFIYSTNQPPAALLLFARCIVVVLIGVPLSPLLAAATAALSLPPLARSPFLLLTLVTLITLFQSRWQELPGIGTRERGPWRTFGHLQRKNENEWP